MKSCNCKKEDLLLYAVTDRAWTGEQSLYEQCKDALEGGVTMLQLREKNLDEQSFYDEAVEIKKLCNEYGVPFIVNDNVDIGVRVGADGVHVGQSDMQASNVRSLIGENKILGVSAQTVEQAVKAQENGADYLGVGAVFPTGSKDDAEEITFDTLKAICDAVTIPVVAIGGVALDNIEKLKDSGIVGISVISAIFAAKDIKEATEDLYNKTKEIVK